MSFSPYIIEAPYYAPDQALREEFNDDKPLVLVAEDHEDTRFMIRTMLEMIGCQVLEAANGSSAIEVARREQPRLILMDGNMPLLDGLSATRLMRGYSELADVPIVALSGQAKPEFHAAALAAGCDDYFVKPIEFEQIKNLISGLFHMFPDASQNFTGTRNHRYADAATHITR